MIKKLIHLVMAARPNMMKVAPLYHALTQEPWANVRLVHTGQHYDDAMSGAFLRDFNLPDPHHHLGIGSGTHAEQTGLTMIAYETLCRQVKPDLTIVVGDVNATIACGLAAKKLNIPLAHLEAGLRSGDRTMPEEINRLAVDAISDYLWTPSRDATAQLKREGAVTASIAEVGNMMIDAYEMMRDRIAADNTRASMNLSEGRYAVMTFHRPGNVDYATQLTALVTIMEQIANNLPVVFPIHPRTLVRLNATRLIDRLEAHPMIFYTDPLPYIPFMNLVSGARFVVTDSGGVQEESSYLGIPCLTLRSTTERPITISEGTNKLTGYHTLVDDIRAILAAPRPMRPQIAGWDGHAAARTVKQIRSILSVQDDIATASSKTAA